MAKVQAEVQGNFRLGHDIISFWIHKQRNRSMNTETKTRVNALPYLLCY